MDSVVNSSSASSSSSSSSSFSSSSSPSFSSGTFPTEDSVQSPSTSSHFGMGVAPSKSSASPDYSPPAPSLLKRVAYIVGVAASATAVVVFIIFGLGIPVIVASAVAGVSLFCGFYLEVAEHAKFVKIQARKVRDEEFVQAQERAQKFAEEFNAGGVNLCVTMLGKQIGDQGYAKVINTQTITTMETEFQRRSGAYRIKDTLGGGTNFSATAFNKNTAVNLIGSWRLAGIKQCNVGFSLNPQKLEPIKVAVPGDGWTKLGGHTEVRQVPKKNPETGVKNVTHYISTEAPYMKTKASQIAAVEPKNKARKGTVQRPKQSTVDTLSAVDALVKYTNKHLWGSAWDNPYKMHPLESSTTNELLFMPETTNYFDAVDYIIVDNSFLNSGDVTKLAQWAGIIKLSQQLAKPILVIQKGGLTFMPTL